MSTRAELETKWSKRLEEWRSLGVHVNGEKIAGEILEDLRAIGDAGSRETMTPHEAAAITNYHPESICRLVRRGKVKNYGTKHRPRVRLDELPRKSAPSAPQPEAPKPERTGAHTASINSIARDVVAGRIGRR